MRFKNISNYRNEDSALGIPPGLIQKARITVFMRCCRMCYKSLEKYATPAENLGQNQYFAIVPVIALMECLLHMQHHRNSKCSISAPINDDV